MNQYTALEAVTRWSHALALADAECDDPKERAFISRMYHQMVAAAIGNGATVDEIEQAADRGVMAMKVSNG